MHKDDVLIAGGGIGGLCAALCLARQGYRVRVLEQATDFCELGAGIQLSPNCTRVLHALGLESALSKFVFLPQSRQTRNWRTGEIISENLLGDSVRVMYGFPYYHIHRGDLMRVLSNAARANPAVTLHTNARVLSVEPLESGAAVQVGGVRYEAMLVVGADGIHSTVRSSLFGPEAATFTGNVAWRGLVPAKRLPAGFVRPVASSWWGPGRHFVHYYVRGGELVNCVCVVEKEGWELESWTERGDLAELKQDFVGWHEAVQRLIDSMDPDACFKWALFDRPPMPRWSQGHVTLLGDACHPSLPFMAQGAAMAIEDGAVLAGCITRGETLSAGLERYEKLRRERTAAVQTGSRRNARLYHLEEDQVQERNKTAHQERKATLEWLYRYDAFAPN